MAYRKVVRPPLLRVLVKDTEVQGRWEWVSPEGMSWQELSSRGVLKKMDDKTKAEYVPVLL